MNVRISVALSFASLLWLISPVQAQNGTAYLTEDPSAIDSSGSVYGVTPLGVQGSRIWAGANVGNRPGNVSNFFSVGGFMPIQLYGPESAFFLDAEGWVNENGDPGVDFGGGYRHMIDPLNSIIGVNTFFTFDNADSELSYRRYGFGLEWLTEYVTATGNLYLPIDRGVRDFGGLIYTNDAYFSGQNLFFRNIQRGEQQLKGGDVEVGLTIPQATWMTVYGGGYFYDGNLEEDVNGFQGRVQFDLSSVVANVSYTNDSQFGSTVYGSLQYLLGPGIPQFTPRTRDFYSRMYDGVSHRRRVFTQEVRRDINELALRPDGDGTTPYTFTHINNTNANPGDGTFENPYNTLDGANGNNGQIILVYRGDTTITNPLDGGIGLTLQNNQIVLGEGTEYLLSFSNRPGFLPLPGFDSTGPNPFVTADPGRNVFNLANNNLIQGLNILSPTNGAAIAGNGVNNFAIRDINQNLAGANSGLGAGIVLQNASGVGSIQNVGFRGMSATAAGGIVIDNVNANPLNLTVDGVPFLTGGATGVRLSGNNSEIDATLRNVLANANGRGLDVVASNGGDVSVSVVDSTFTNANVDHGMAVRSSTTGVATLVASNVNASNAALDGLFIEANNGTSAANISGSNLSGADRNGVNVQGTGATGIANVQIVNTNGSGAGVNGVNMNLTNDATATITLVDSNFNDAQTGSGFAALVDDSTATIAVNNTTLQNAAVDGLQIVASNGAQVNGTLSNGVNMNDAGRNAINLQSSSGADISVTGTGNGVRGANAGRDAINLSSTGAGSNTILSLTNPGTFANAGQDGALLGSGVNITGQNSGNVGLSILGNPTSDALFSNASRDGVTISLDGSSTSTIDLNYIRLDNAGRDAFNANVVDSSILTITGLRNADLQNAGRDGLHLTAGTDGAINGTLDGVRLDNAGDDAIFMSAVTGADISITGNAVSGPGAADDAIDLRADGAGTTVQLNLTNTGSFLNPGDNGIEFQGNNSGTIGFNIAGGNFNQANNGVSGFLDNGAVATIALSGATFDDATLNGMQITANNGARFTGAVQNSSFANAGLNALEFDFDNGGGVANLSTLGFLDTAMNNATVDAINIVATNNSFFNLGITNTSLALPGLSNYGDNLLDKTANGGSVVNVLIDPTNATTNKATSTNGIQVNITGAGTQSIVTMLDSPISNLAAPIGQNAVFGNVTDGARFDLTLDNSEISNAGASGIDVTLTNGSIFNASLLSTSIDGATLDGVRVNATNSSVNIAGGNSTRTGVPQTGLSVDGAGQDGFDITLNNSIGVFNLDNFSMDVNSLNGFKLTADGASTQVASSFIQNGTFNNNGVAGLDNSAGISITATNGAQIGSRAGLLGGIGFTNVTATNTDNNARVQDNGLRVNVDSDGYVGMAFNNANFSRNEGNGVDVVVNGDLSLNDTALANLGFSNSFINENHGDGASLRAFNGDDVFGNPQTSGIIFSANTTEFNQNGNGPAVGGYAGNPPQTGANGDGVGFGINALAQGDNSVAGNTQITINLLNSSLVNNEEGSINPAQTNGGVVNLNIVGGVVDIAGLNQICANGPLDIRSISLDNVTLLPNPGGPGFSICAYNNGQVLASLSNLTIAGNAGVGIVTDAQTGGDINLSLNSVVIQNNGNLADPQTGLAAIAAIQSLVDGAGSTTNLTLNNVDILDHANLNAIEAVITNGGTYTGVFDDVVSNNNNELATEGSLEVRATGAGSVANLDINGYTNEQSNGSGVNLIGTAGGQLNVTQFDNISLTNNTTRGVNVQVDGIQNFVANNVQVTGAGQIGVNIEAASVIGGAANVTLNNVTANNAAQGLNLALQGLTATDTANVTISNGTFNNATAGPGANILLSGVDGSTGTLNVNGLTANSSAGNGIQVQATGGLDLAVPTFNNISATNSVGTGLIVNQNSANGNLTQFNMTTGNFNGSANGVVVNTVNSNAATNISLTDVTANGPPAGAGVQVFASGLAGTSNINLTNVDATNRALGAQIVTAGAVAGATTNVNVTGGSDFSNSTGLGLQVVQTGAGTTGNILVQNVTANASANPIVLQQSGLTGGASSITVDSVSAQNSTAGDGLLVQALGLGATDSVDVNVTNSNFLNAFQDGIEIDLDGAVGSTATVDISGVNVNSAGVDGIFITPLGGLAAAINTLNNVQATDAGSVGINIFAAAPSAVTAINANTIDVSRAQDTGLNIQLGGQTQTTAINLQNVTANDTVNGDNIHIHLINVGAGNANTLAMNNVTADSAGDDGIDLMLETNTVLNITQFNNVSAQQNEENGMKIEVASGSSIPNFVASGINLSNNGTSGVGFDGLDVKVHGAGSQATFNLANLTINNSGGRGVDLDTYDGGSLTFNINGGTIGSSGLGGLDINVGQQEEFGFAPTAPSQANFAGSFTNLNVTNSGTSGVFTADGVNVNVAGNGTAGGFGAGGVTANLTFTGGSSTANDGDGYDFVANNGAVMNVTGTGGVNGSSNVGRGLAFTADGATSVVSLNLTGANTFSNNLGASGAPVAGDGPGVDVLLTNGVTATNLVVSATANNNDGDGVRIRANDGTGVTINNLDTSGVIANNNQGSGLVIDLNAVNGVNSFAMNNASFSGNLGDQVRVQFREMNLTDVNFTNVSVTGAAGSGDGIDLRLIDSSVTNQLTFNNVTAINNGGHGLNVLVDEQVAGGNVGQVAAGIITRSQFSGNTLSGANLVFGGAGVNNMYIFENSTAFGPSDGFRNNGQSGLAIRIEDTAVFNINGANPINGAGAFYENQFNGNGNIGFSFIANEPADPNPLDLDGIGPVYNLNLGDILRNPNEFTNNGEAGLAIEGRNDSTGTINLVNAIMTGNTNVAGGNFNGDGFAVRLENNAILTDLMINGTASGLDMNNNAGSGLYVTATQNSRLGTNTNLTILDTTISGNGRHGVEIERRDSALFGLNAATNIINIGQAGALAAGTENRFANNALSGVNIFNANSPGLPVPLQVNMTENVFQANRDGTFMHGVGNAQFTGALTDNNYINNTRDGARFLLENDAALGDPNNVAGTPFLLAGNQITGSGRHGVFFDTNATNESGLFSGGAYVNAFITGGTVNARTLISGSGGNGVQIIDNSDYFNPAPVGTQVAQNTYRITRADINGNNDGINAIQAQAGTSINANTGINLIIGDPAAVDRRDVRITNNRDDGIDLLLRDADSTNNRLTINRTEILGNGFAGDGEDATIAGRGHGIEIDQDNAGRLIATFTNVDIIQNGGDGIDWSVTANQESTASPANVTMTGTNISQNAERGLDVRLRHDVFSGVSGNQSGAQAGSTSVWNLGAVGGPANRFNENGREGIVFDLQATGIDPDVVNINGTTGVITDTNNDIFIDTNITFQGGYPRGFPAGGSTISTAHPLLGAPSFSGNPIQETRRRVQATVNLLDSQVANNGGLNGFEDGFAAGIGFSTRLNLTVAGVGFGGNIGDDLRLFAQRSGTYDLPVGSVNNNPAALVNGLPQNFAIYDPVAYLDFQFGSVAGVTRGNGRAVNFVDFDLDGINDVGDGNQINIITVGTGQTAQIANTGIISGSNDAFRSATRSVALAGQVQIGGTFNNTTINDFFQNGVQQNIGAQFGLFIQNPFTVFPDPTFPP